MDEQQPPTDRDGLWTRDEFGDFTWWAPGHVPDPRQTPIDPPTFGPEDEDAGDGYRIRSDAVWDRARADYLAGDTAEAVCDRYDLKVGTLRYRAAKQGWRRSDQDDPEPLPGAVDDDPDAPLDFGTMARDALTNVRRAVAKGRAAEAASWLRLHQRLTDLAQPSAPAAPAPVEPPSRPRSPPDPFAATNRAALAVTRLANELATLETGDPIARRALEAEFAALEASFSDLSDDSDPVFSTPGSGTELPAQPAHDHDRPPKWRPG